MSNQNSPEVILASFEKGTSLTQDAITRLKKNKMAMFGLYVLLFMVVVALLTPWIAPYSYEEQNLDLGASAPSVAHWLGTDILGRDQLTRIMYGSRISLMVGFIATSVALLIGVLWGAIAGFMGGKVVDGMVSHIDIFPTVCDLLGIEPPGWVQG